jgi:hypothetical protein
MTIEVTTYKQARKLVSRRDTVIAVELGHGREIARLSKAYFIYMTKQRERLGYAGPTDYEENPSGFWFNEEERELHVPSGVI